MRIIYMYSSLFLLYLLLLDICAALDTVYVYQPIKDGKTIVSNGNMFELGFFSPGNSKNRYLGIWYKKISVCTVVWVANRETPITDKSGMFKITRDGNLEILNGSNSMVWSSKSTVSGRSNNSVVQLLDSGNLVVWESDKNKNMIWQSFDYLGDTFLPGMKFGKDLITGKEWSMTSWKSPDDPSTGLYSDLLDTNGYPQIFGRHGGILISRLGPWNGLGYSGGPIEKKDPISSCEFVVNEKEIYYKYELKTSVIQRSTVMAASIIGVSSLYQLPTKPTTLSPNLFFPFISHKPTKLRHHIALAVSAHNSVISEDVFEGLSLFHKDSSLEPFDDNNTNNNVVVIDGGNDADELDVSRLGLPQRLVQTLEKRGITNLFPIQRAVLVPALEGRDIIGRAKTGTGKTLAFAIPIIKRVTEEDEENRNRLAGRLPRVLVLAPTRELAKQVETEIKESAPYLRTVCVYGGVSYTLQKNQLTRGVDIVVGTPGRLIDLVNSNVLKLGEVQFLVLDEADQMLAVGFEEDVETILEKLPPQRQSMLFSATMPRWVQKLSRKYLKTPLTIDLVGDQDEKLAEGIKLYAIPTTSTTKRSMLGDLVTVYAKGGKTIIFTQTKRDADEVSMALTSSIASEALHGDISQHQRERTLNGFRQGKFTVLVATDVASRGLDIPNVDLVIHYELPNDPETFVHRSGRTGRAGKEGKAILMYTNSQRRTVKTLEQDVGCKFEFISPPGVDDVLGSSAEQVIATLSGVHDESIDFFTPTAQKLYDQQGTRALAAALAHMSGFSQPPSSRSLITHEQGWTTLQMTRDSDSSIKGYMSARTVTGFLSSVYATAAGVLGKIHVIADKKVQGAVFDLPEDIAKNLLSKEMPLGTTITKISKLPVLEDDGPASDFYGRFSNRERSSRGGRRDSDSSGSHGGWGGNNRFSSGDEANNNFRRGGRSGGRGGGSSWSSGGSRSGGSDWLISDRRRTPSSGNRDRDFAGPCFHCGRSGHRASECPKKQDY